MPVPVLINAPVDTVSLPDIDKDVPAELTSMVLVVAAVRVKSRSELAVSPVYCKVPPPRIRLVAALVDWPMLLAIPPSPIVSMHSMPTLMIVAPEYVLIPDSVTVPVSVLVNEYGPPLSLIIPDSVKEPVPPTELSANKVISPAHDAVPEPEIAPDEAMPVPLIVRGSAPMATLLISNVDPEFTVVPATVAPKALACWAVSVPPAPMVAAPVNELLPLRIRVPPDPD